MQEANSKTGTLFFFCGKMGAGKSTRAIEIAGQTGAVLLSEDDWLAQLYPEIKDFDDYLKYSSRLKPLLVDHVRQLLAAGLSVVMDFPGNTRKQRAWFNEIIADENTPHRLIYLKADDAVCLQRLEQRRKTNPERADFDTEAVFHHVTGFFEPPAGDEGFKVEQIDVCHNEDFSR